jgi:chemotaxis protein methyltransferase CheR
LRDRYFRRQDDGFLVDPALRGRVRWGVANLAAEDTAVRYAGVPVIFCRNVFIYFSTDVVGRVAASFYRWMPSPGYLFLGSAESLMRVATTFELEQMGGAFVYVKR